MKTNRLALLLLAASGFALSACALDASTEPVASGTQPVYRTGSNIAKGRTAVTSDGVTAVSAEQAERALRGTPQMPAPLSGSH
jgi:outer membrane biogenesis lipoprotein LolB